MAPPDRPISYTRAAMRTKKSSTQQSSISLRMTPGQRRVLLIFAIVIPVTGLVAGSGTVRIMDCVLGLLFMLAYFVQGLWGIDVDETGVTLTGYRRRFIPWADVKRIEPVEIGFGTKRTAVVLNDESIRRSYAPITGFLQKDVAFDDKLTALSQFTKRHTTKAPKR